MIPVEAIERVIDDFRTRIEKLRRREKSGEIIGGAIIAYELAVKELQKVFEDYGTSKS